MYVDVSHVNFHAKAHCSGKDVGKTGLLKKSMYGARDAARTWGDWQGLLESWGYELGAVQGVFFTTRKRKPRV